MTVADLLERNKAWASRVRGADDGFFRRLAREQRPEYLWIGCSDSRVEASHILDLGPGQVFTHRNVANVVAPADLNCQSVVQFAVDVLKVRNIMVVGHYGCAGIQAAVEGSRLGLVDVWLQHIQDVQERHRDALRHLEAHDKLHRLCELNIADQFLRLGHCKVVADAWRRGQALAIHGLVYDLRDGLLRELGLAASHASDVEQAYTSFTRQARAARMGAICGH